ncbi:hypothetical protein EDF27_2149 [Curtobacterium sp. PhB136]|nr:hypothetical protein EDF27_2149 [Curtobacterium sp. PhB136]
MLEHKWAPPEHPDVALDEPYGLGPEHIEGPGERLATPRPVYVWIRYQHAGLLRLRGFAVAHTPVAVLVQVTWQGRLQQVWCWRAAVKNRTLKERRRPRLDR